MGVYREAILAIQLVQEIPTQKARFLCYVTTSRAWYILSGLEMSTAAAASAAAAEDDDVGDDDDDDDVGDDDDEGEEVQVLTFERNIPVSKETKMGILGRFLRCLTMYLS